MESEISKERDPGLDRTLPESIRVSQVNAIAKWNRANCPKRSYRNRAIAERKLRELQEEGRREASYYLCEVCKRWHLTSKEQQQ